VDRGSAYARSGGQEQVLESLEQGVKSRKTHVQEGIVTTINLWKMMVSVAHFPGKKYTLHEICVTILSIPFI
jgi:hypothetical protein